MAVNEFFIDYTSLDNFQRQLVDRRVNKSMTVVGAAGSGKSVIALHKAKQLVTLGKRVAIIVFTKTLQKYFADGLKELGLSDKVYSLKEFRDSGSRVDYLIVDECQDFTSEEIEYLKNLESRGTYCLLFGDEAQSIMNFPNHQTMHMQDIIRTMGVMPDNLMFNYRLTKEIAALAVEVMSPKDEQLVDKCKRNGVKPYLIRMDTFEEQLDKMIDVIKNNSLKSVGILLPTNEKDKGKMSVEFVKDYFLQKGVVCEFKYNANQNTAMDLDFHSSNPKVMTWWCAKGLQFSDVFIPGCEMNVRESQRAALYVAMTRSCERLYLGYSGRLGRFFPDANSELYFGN